MDRQTEVYKLAELISSRAPELCRKWCTGICEFALWAPKVLSLNEQETLRIVLTRLAKAMHEVSVMSVRHLADANINANRIQASLLFLRRFLHTPRHCFICVLCFFPTAPLVSRIHCRPLGMLVLPLVAPLESAHSRSVTDRSEPRICPQTLPAELDGLHDAHWPSSDYARSDVTGLVRRLGAGAGET